jgi:hypothetical protein
LLLRLKHPIGALLVVCALALVVSIPPAPAAGSASPCWKVLLNDWYDGTIDKLYDVACYRQAIAHLPTDVSVYSSARDDIDRALQVAIAHKKNPARPAAPVTDKQPPPATTTAHTTTASPTTTAAATTTKRGGSARPATTAATTTTTTTPAAATTTASPGRTTSPGPIPSAIDSSSPGGATSFPLPLVILGGLALFLLAAGIVGLVVRRMQGRGEPPATP